MLQQGGSSPAMRATRSGSSSGWVKRRSEMRSAVTHANPKATGFTWQTLCIAWSVPPINQDGAFLQTPFVFPWILYIDPGLNLWRRTLGMHDACNVPERPGLRHRPMHHAMLCYSAVFQKVVNISYHYKCMINVLKRAIIGWYDSARNVSSVRSPYVPNINIMWLRLSKEKKHHVNTGLHNARDDWYRRERKWRFIDSVASVWNLEFWESILISFQEWWSLF